jgi:hypothetical protein
MGDNRISTGMKPILTIIFVFLYSFFLFSSSEAQTINSISENNFYSFFNESLNSSEKNIMNNTVVVGTVNSKGQILFVGTGVFIQDTKKYGDGNNVILTVRHVGDLNRLQGEYNINNDEKLYIVIINDQGQLIGLANYIDLNKDSKPSDDYPILLKITKKFVSLDKYNGVSFSKRLPKSYLIGQIKEPFEISSGSSGSAWYLTDKKDNDGIINITGETIYNKESNDFTNKPNITTLNINGYSPINKLTNNKNYMSSQFSPDDTSKVVAYPITENILKYLNIKNVHFTNDVNINDVFDYCYPKNVAIKYIADFNEIGKPNFENSYSISKEEAIMFNIKNDRAIEIVYPKIKNFGNLIK